jgi:tetratricopeptide (TPR) repeat protein
VPTTQSSAAPAPTPVVNEHALQAYRDILKADPKNVRAATELANLLYDAGRFGEAVTYYQQVFAADPSSVNVSTDLGTALWYLGRADEALAQFEKSLAIEPAHPQTLFNIGIVRSEGKRDYSGAVQSWEHLLSAAPAYPEAERVRRLIDEAKDRGRGN